MSTSNIEHTYKIFLDIACQINRREQLIIDIDYKIDNNSRFVDNFYD